MQSETQKMSNQQGTQNAAKDNIEKQAQVSGPGSDISDENMEPMLDEQDMKDNHLKEEDLDKIEWDQPSKPDEDLSKSN